MSAKSALKELRANAGTQFNPVVVEAFIATVEVRGERDTAQENTQVFEQALAAVRARA
jgi:HD-GYP domain-containing protein (c-di-GMP phosphodiesterase class II)